MPLARWQARFEQYLHDNWSQDDKAHDVALKLPQTMQTEAGRELARHNAGFLVHYMAKLCAELKGEYRHPDSDVIEQFSPLR